MGGAHVIVLGGDAEWDTVLANAGGKKARDPAPLPPAPPAARSARLPRRALNNQPTRVRAQPCCPAHTPLATAPPPRAARAAAPQVVVDFTAAWCGPCRMISPFFEELAEKLHETLVFVKVGLLGCRPRPRPRDNSSASDRPRARASVGDAVLAAVGACRV